MTISCTAVVDAKGKRNGLIHSLNQLGITPQVHNVTVVAEWQGRDPYMLDNLTKLFEPFREHSVYYSTMA